MSTTTGTTTTASEYVYATGDRCEHHRAPVMCVVCSDRRVLAAAYNLREEYRLATADLEDFDPRADPSAYRIPPTSIPCPSWCTLAAGHGFDSFESAMGAPSRGHELRLDSADDTWGVSISSMENLSQQGMTRTTPYIEVYEPGQNAATPEQARAFAAALLRAADRLEHLDDEA